MQRYQDGRLGGSGVRYNGHNAETERLITEVVARLPEPVANLFAPTAPSYPSEWVILPDGAVRSG
jgi:hypothetical protein